MKKLLSVISVLCITLLLTACSNEQIAEAIESCKGDPECYAIVDDAINEELESRGIQSGIMSNKELEQVNDIVESLRFDLFGADINNYSESDLNQIYGAFNNMLHYGELMEIDQDLGTFIETQDSLFRFKIDVLLANEKQYMLIDNAKHMIYKESSDRFKYEIQTPTTVHEFVFDLTFQSISGVMGNVTTEEFEEIINQNDELTLTSTYLSAVIDKNDNSYIISFYSLNGVFVAKFDGNSITIINGPLSDFIEYNYELDSSYSDNPLVQNNDTGEDYIYDYDTFINDLFTTIGLDSTTELGEWVSNQLTQELIDELIQRVYEN